MKKIISLLSAFAISASMFAGLAVTSYAAPANVNSNPVIQITVDDEFDGDGYIQLNGKLLNNEALSYAYSKSKYTSNGINAIEITVKLDSNVFDTSEAYIAGGFTGCGVSGDNTDTLKFVFAPTTVDTYMTTVPENLFTISVLPKSGNTNDEEARANIPSSAVTFGACQVEYTKYNNIKAADALTEANAGVNYFYTIYNVNAAQENDYDLTVNFIGTAAEEDDDDEPTVTPVAMDAGVEIAEGPHAGKTSVSAPEAVAVADFAKIEITNDVDTSKTLEWTAPTTLGDGKTNVLAVLVFDKAAMAGSTFTVKYLNAASEAIKIFTHAVAQ